MLIVRNQTRLEIETRAHVLRSFGQSGLYEQGDYDMAGIHRKKIDGSEKKRGPVRLQKETRSSGRARNLNNMWKTPGDENDSLS